MHASDMAALEGLISAANDFQTAINGITGVTLNLINVTINGESVALGRPDPVEDIWEISAN